MNCRSALLRRGGASGGCCRRRWREEGWGEVSSIESLSRLLSIVIISSFLSLFLSLSSSHLPLLRAQARATAAPGPAPREAGSWRAGAGEGGVGEVDDERASSTACSHRPSRCRCPRRLQVPPSSSRTWGALPEALEAAREEKRSPSSEGRGWEERREKRKEERRTDCWLAFSTLFFRFPLLLSLLSSLFSFPPPSPNCKKCEFKRTSTSSETNQ